MTELEVALQRLEKIAALIGRPIRIDSLEARLASVTADRDMLRDVVGLYLSRSAPVPNEDGGRPGWVAAYVEMREFGRATEIYQGIGREGQ